MTGGVSEMVERGARRLAARHYAERFGKDESDPHVKSNVDGNWHIFVTQVRDVIESMREPTEAMRAVALRWSGDELDQGGLCEFHEAMIDSALASAQSAETSLRHPKDHWLDNFYVASA